MAKKTETPEKSVSVEPPKKNRACFEIEGSSDLIQNCFSQKAVEQMLRKHMGMSSEREKKKPREVIESATIRNVDDRVCIPPAAFKKAILTACLTIKLPTKTKPKVQLFIVGQSIPITFEKMIPRMDMVRLPNGNPDVRFRPSFHGWKARLLIEYADALSVETITDLLGRAGSVGVGEFRPEKNGTFGTFRPTRMIGHPEVTDVISECSSPIKGLVIPEWAMDTDIDPELLKRIANQEGEDVEGAAPEEKAS